MGDAKSGRSKRQSYRRGAVEKGVVVCIVCTGVRVVTCCEKEAKGSHATASHGTNRTK